MKLDGTTALVTGANRGLGRHLAQQLRDQGVRVYAGARRPESVDFAGVTPIALDITDPASVAEAARTATGVSILVNNAGIVRPSALLGGDLGAVREEFETNVLGTLEVTRAFAPSLAEHPESYVLNVLSVLSWLTLPGTGGYSASKAAAWALTNALRQELAPQGTRVGALHVGYMDTDLTAGIDAPKLDPAQVAQLVVEGIAEGRSEILADELSEQVRAGLAGGVAALYPDVA
jgi:NAD(P)-dependent dehydrogenase (short-subunit alcohol dehydrogenase family)